MHFLASISKAGEKSLSDSLVLSDILVEVQTHVKTFLDTAGLFFEAISKGISRSPLELIILLEDFQHSTPHDIAFVEDFNNFLDDMRKTVKKNPVEISSLVDSYERFILASFVDLVPELESIRKQITAQLSDISEIQDELRIAKEKTLFDALFLVEAIDRVNQRVLQDKVDLAEYFEAVDMKSFMDILDQFEDTETSVHIHNQNYLEVLVILELVAKLVNLYTIEHTPLLETFFHEWVSPFYDKADILLQAIQFIGSVYPVDMTISLQEVLYSAQIYVIDDPEESSKNDGNLSSLVL